MFNCNLQIQVNIKISFNALFVVFLLSFISLCSKEIQNFCKSTKYSIRIERLLLFVMERHLNSFEVTFHNKLVANKYTIILVKTPV